MREQLIQYVSLLFAGAQNAEDIRQEILQNTLDRYDDMISQGKAPEAAYRLAISGIGDINEILGTVPCAPVPSAPSHAHSENTQSSGRLLRTIAIGLYILSPVPLFLLSDFGLSTIGLCGTFFLVAIATVMIILGKKSNKGNEVSPGKKEYSPREELKQSISALVWAIGLISYFVVSFLTNAWFITWVIFPMTGAVQGIAKACVDLKEG